MTNSWKTLMSVLLLLAMLVSMLPFAAFAEDGQTTNTQTEEAAKTDDAPKVEEKVGDAPKADDEPGAAKTDESSGDAAEGTTKDDAAKDETKDESKDVPTGDTEHPPKGDAETANAQIATLEAESQAVVPLANPSATLKYNVNGGTSTSDTGAAVIVRDGWSTAEARAKSDEANFKRSEREFLKVALSIIRRAVGTELLLKDVDIKFTRHNYDNIQSKAQVLVSMLNNSHIHPALAFEHCGMFSDPQSAFNMSENYYQEQMQKWEPVDVNDDLQQTG